MGLHAYDSRLRLTGAATRRREPRLGRTALCIAAAGSFLVLGAAGCDDDGTDETFETPNGADGDPTEGTPAGGVDSRDDGSPDGE